MNPNGAPSNHAGRAWLRDAAAHHSRLVARARVTPACARPVPLAQGRSLKTVTGVLKAANTPMQVREIRVAAQELLGEKLLRPSVTSCLVANAGTR